MKRTFIVMGAFALLAGLQNARGQSIAPSVLNATGGTRTIGTHEHDWSVGEVALVSTFYGANVIVTQGLLQNDISIGVHVADVNLIRNLEVFPNPASSIVNIRFTAPGDGTLSYKLLDMAGRVAMTQSNPVTQGTVTEQFNISEFAVATYMLEITFKDNNGSEANTSYKIQKLN